MSKNNNTQKIVGLGLFTAIVIVLQLMGSFIRFGTFSISLVLVPVVIGAALYGAGAGAWLGFVFGVVVLLSGDAAAFLGVNALGTILTVLVKGTLAGLLSGLVYKALENKNRTLAVAVAAVVCPVVNTGVFLIGCLLFFMETIGGWADAMGFGANIGQYMIVGLVGANFIFELLFNVVLSPVVVRLIRPRRFFCILDSLCQKRKKGGTVISAVPLIFCTSMTVSRVLYLTVIYLRAALPRYSSHPGSGRANLLLPYRCCSG